MGTEHGRENDRFIIKDPSRRFQTAQFMSIALLMMHLHIPGCGSLKEKRSKIKPVLSRLHREFNVAAAEMDLQDVWQDVVIGCTTLSSDPAQNQRLLQQVIAFTERSWPDLELIDHRIELI